MEDFKKDIDSNTIIVRDFNTPLSKMDRSCKQNIKKDIVSLNTIVIDHMIGYKTSLNKYKTPEIISSIFPGLKGQKLETNLKGKKTKTPKIMETE